MFDLSNQQDRIIIINEINGPENKSRKALSLKQFEVINDRLEQYVVEYLRQQFAYKTVKEIPVISSLNLARRTVKQEASLYRQAPKRKFYGMSDEQAEAFESFYDDFGWNDRFQSANEYYRLQLQTHLYWTLKDKMIKPKVLLNHHLDVIPNATDPEEAEAYVISAFDKQQFIRYRGENQTATGFRGVSELNSHQDGSPKKIGDPDDYRKALDKYVVWSPEFNYVMDRYGVIESEDRDNPLEGGVMPIVEIAGQKDFEYWVRSGQSVVDFTIQFCGMMSDLANVVRMQGFGQAVMTGPDNMLPEQLQIGPTFVLRLPQDPNNPVPTDFKFVTANADISGSLEVLKSTLSMFLSSRGIDPNTISLDGSSQSFSSGIERLLSMIQKFEASKSDMDLFRKAEMRSFEIIKSYINTYQGTEFLDERFQIGDIPDDAYMTVEFAEPQMMETESERLASIRTKVEMGLLSQVDAYMDYHKVDEATAVKKLSEIEPGSMGFSSVSARSTRAQSGEDRLEQIPQVEAEEVSMAVDEDEAEAALRKEVALNGAQVSSLVSVIDAVAHGQLPRASGVEIIVTAFNVEPSTADRMMGDVGRGFTPRVSPDESGSRNGSRS